MELSEKQLAEIARSLEKVRDGCPTLEAYLDWLKGAYYAHESAVVILRNRLDGLRALALEFVSRPLTVAEARLLDVCRVCRKKAAAPLLLNYGKEFAHTACVNGGGESCAATAPSMFA